MGHVISNLSMSLDGFVEDANGSVEQLFEWYGSGPVEVKSANPAISFRLSADDAVFLERLLGRRRPPTGPLTTQEAADAEESRQKKLSNEEAAGRREPKDASDREP